MIPLCDVIPSRTRPLMVMALVAGNVLVFLAALAALGGDVASRALDWAYRPPLIGIAGSLFLHAGWAQLVSNLLCLWIFGANVEDRMGHARFLVFYLLCGIAAGLAHEAAGPRTPAPALGSAPAVAGVMGAYFVLYPTSRVLTLIPFALVETPAVLYLTVWLIVQLLIAAGAPPGPGGSLMGPALFALAAGFAAGAALVRVFRRRDRARVEWWSDGLRSRTDGV
jgi:membrane associated rhomboid family serine protease